MLVFVFLAVAHLSNASHIEAMFPVLPLRNGLVDSLPDHPCHYSYSIDGLMIHSKTDSCFATNDGVVLTTFDLGGEFAVLVNATDGRFYTYAGFDRLFVSKNDSVTHGSFIGLLIAREDEFELLYMISDKKGKILPRKYHLQYLQHLQMNMSCAERKYSYTYLKGFKEVSNPRNFSCYLF